MVISKQKDINHNFQGNFLWEGMFQALGTRKSEARDAVWPLFWGDPTKPFFSSIDFVVIMIHDPFLVCVKWYYIGMHVLKMI